MNSIRLHKHDAFNKNHKEAMSVFPQDNKTKKLSESRLSVNE